LPSDGRRLTCYRSMMSCVSVPEPFGCKPATTPRMKVVFVSAPWSKSCWHPSTASAPTQERAGGTRGELSPTGWLGTRGAQRRETAKAIRYTFGDWKQASALDGSDTTADREDIPGV